MSDAHYRDTGELVENQKAQAQRVSIEHIEGTLPVGDGSGPLTVDGTVHAVLDAGGNVIGHVILDASSAVIGHVIVDSLPSIAGSVTADTELPAAAALTDDMANPTAPAVAGHNMVWDGATWDRAAGGTGAAAGSARVSAHMGSSLTDGAAGSPSGLLDHAGNTRALAMVRFLYNGSTYDRERANIESSLLASGARTTSTNAPDTTNYSGKGVILILNVTVQPGGAETLSLKIQAKDSISGNYVDIADAGVLFTAATGTKGLAVHTGAVAADSPAAMVTKSIPLPRTWRAVVTHSAAGSWTYSLSAVQVV